MKLPPPATLTALVGDLIGQRVTAKTIAAAALDPRSHVAASYHDAEGVLVAVALCDVAVGASLAAAMTMVPAVRVDECVKAKALDPILSENLHEVFNVMAAAFPMSGAPRVILREVRHNLQAQDDVATVLGKPAARMDLDVAVGGYRSGRLALLAA